MGFKSRRKGLTRPEGGDDRPKLVGGGDGSRPAATVSSASRRLTPASSMSASCLMTTTRSLKVILRPLRAPDR